MKKILFSLFFLVASFSLSQQTGESASNAISICESSTDLSNQKVIQLDKNISVKTATCSGTSFSKAVFYKISPSIAGKFTFTLRTNVGVTDIDWALWKNVNHNDIMNGTIDPDRMSITSSYGPQGATGMNLTSTYTCDIPGSHSSGGFIQYLDVVPGDELILAILLPSTSTDVPFKINLGGPDGGGGDTSFKCVLPPEDISYCSSDKEEKYGINEFNNYLRLKYSLNDGKTYHIDHYRSESDALNEVNKISDSEVITLTHTLTKLYTNIYTSDKSYIKYVETTLGLLKVPKPTISYKDL